MFPVQPPCYYSHLLGFLEANCHKEAFLSQASNKSAHACVSLHMRVCKARGLAVTYRLTGQTVDPVYVILGSFILLRGDLSFLHAGFKKKAFESESFILTPTPSCELVACSVSYEPGGP